MQFDPSAASRKSQLQHSMQSKATNLTPQPGATVGLSNCAETNEGQS